MENDKIRQTESERKRDWNCWGRRERERQARMLDRQDRLASRAILNRLLLVTLCWKKDHPARSTAELSLAPAVDRL